MTSKPTRKELLNHVIPQYASVWKKIGRQLGLSDSAIAIIEQDHSAADVQRCCHGMFSKWLEMNTDASWQKLFAVIDNCAGEYFINIVGYTLTL